MQTRSPFVGALVVATALAAGLFALSSAAVAAAAGADGTCASPTGHDLKAIGYVENAHGQLEEWRDRLAARLERGLGPRDPEPILDGRAALQTAKIAITYAGYVDSEPLAELLEELAAAHIARLVALRVRLEDADRAGASPEARAATYLELDARIDELMSRVRDWRPDR